MKNSCLVSYLSGIQNLSKYIELINLRSIKIPKVCELNFWCEDEEIEEDKTLVCIYFPVRGKYLMILLTVISP